ncbi:phage holin [Bifidobacterium adolescentis]|uniref:phage holin n=1 Tax=Bifidobacterium adolescentis TaxID=1680 RepID=UPI00062E4C83|nr:phage holin [Bifidobacterium adolescentis]KLE27010.1 hypothetical protein AAX71_08560 [Bifidobacterium adolescentis]
MDKDTKTELDYLLPDKAYEILKWVALIALPAVAWLVGAVGPQWGLLHCGEIVTTINAVGVFVGALIGVSQLTATKPDDDSDKD